METETTTTGSRQPNGLTAVSPAPSGTPLPYPDYPATAVWADRTTGA